MHMSEKTTVLIADDHPIVRQGFVKVIERDPSFKIIAESGDGERALRLLRELKPDIAVLDISMPDMSGLEIIKQIGDDNLPTRFVILTMYKDPEYFDTAIDVGVKGYILKESATGELLNCLRMVSQNKYYISPLLSGYLLERDAKIKSLNNRMPALSKLTRSEKRILKLIAENKTSREIADDLCVSPRTVQNHRTNICNKLGLKGHNKLLLFAVRNKSLL
jgi:DNA-binding NarL/FixJ family response regulator